MMGTEIFKIDASWAEKLRKTRVPFLMTPSVFSVRPAAASEYLVRCAVRHRSSCVGTGLARQRVGELASKMLT